MDTTRKLPYTVLEPGSQEHRNFISEAILSQDIVKLAALKNRVHLPIHLVSNWFYYTMMTIDSTEDVVIIHTAEDRATLQRLSESGRENNIT